MNNRALTALNFVEFLHTRHPEIHLYGPIVRDIVSGDINKDEWNGDVTMITPYNPNLHLPELQEIMGDPVLADTYGQAIIAQPTIISARNVSGTIFNPQLGGSVCTLHFRNQVPRPAINVDSLRMTEGHIGVLNHHAPGAPHFNTLLWQCMNHQFSVDLFNTDPNPYGEATIVDRAKYLIAMGWSCPDEQLPLLGIAPAPALTPFELTIDAGIPGTVPGVVYTMPGAVPAEQPPNGVLAPIGTVTVPLVETLQAIDPDMQTGRGAQRTLRARPNAIPNTVLDDVRTKQQRMRNMTDPQRLQVGEIERVRDLTDKFVKAHQTPDEKIGDAHGQDIAEYAQVFDADTSGFGANGWS